MVTFGDNRQEAAMNGRREFLRYVLPTAAVGVATLNTNWLARTMSATAAIADRPATEVAADEGFWREIQQAFTLDRTIINFNNGYTCPSPRVVHEALKRYLDTRCVAHVRVITFQRPGREHRRFELRNVVAERT